MSATIFQAPFDEWPQGFCFLSASFGQCITGRSVGYHGRIATVTRTVPDVNAFGDDGTWNRFPFVVHETGEMQVGVECGCVSVFIAHEREERVDVFGLVIRPKGRIVGFATRSVHRSAFGFVDALATTDLGEGEHTVDDRIRSFQYKLAHQFVH